VLSAGRIVRRGGKELALELEAEGYGPYEENPEQRVPARGR